MPSRDDRIRLRHMLDASREAMGYMLERMRSDLEEDTMLARALVNCLAVIGETAACVTPETRRLDESIPWAQIIGMRNRLQATLDGGGREG